MDSSTISTVDEYIASFPANIQEKLQAMREHIVKKLPEVEESFIYGMAAYHYKKRPIIYFAAHRIHIGIYALPGAHAHLKVKLKAYKQGKDSVQISFAKPIPFDLITDLMNYNLLQLLQ